MNRFTILVIILIVGGGYYIFQDQKEKDLARLICSDHFKTQEKSCLDEYWNYPFRLSDKIAKKNLSEYKNKIKSIENNISLLEYDLDNFNALEYEPLTISGLGLPKEYNKVIISHKNTGDFFDVSCRIVFEYQTCLTSKTYDYNNDEDVVNTEVVKITNIENFPEIKKILDELHKYNFRHYKIVVYGDLKKEIVNTKVRADLIKLEKLDLDDRVYESSLSTGLYFIKQEEFETYFKNKFPNKTVPKLTNSVYYK